ncbi:ABC transporter permease [Mucilaginibacter gynuensis]|uniref:ABC transporter permease n=1 Tax=Mucilaginibacter gynuensis TaxID=1302236 RepID=A0ABP8G9X3_9SPHI
MLKNYFKIAIAVLKRRKFFTFISLFGISFTLTILMVTAAFIDKLVNDNYPDRKRERSLYISGLEQRGKESMNGSSLSYYFLTHFIGSIKTPVKMAFSTSSDGTNTYINDKKIAISYKYVNNEYWEILEYDFLEGKAFTKQQIDNAERVTVISDDLKKAYFGVDAGPVVGKYIEADNVKYRISGVVKSVPSTAHKFFSDIYLPYTVSKSSYKNKDYGGPFSVILLAASKEDVPKMKKEFDQMAKKIPMSDKQYDHLNIHADSYLESYVRTGNEQRSGMAYAIIALVSFGLLVTILPTLNLVNINITRIMERSSEIGVRKAFGASSKTLVYQFIIENMILTFIGGIIGVVLSVISLKLINDAQLIANLNLGLNFTVLFCALIMCVFFGLLSGVYPAWRMSRLNVVTALKAQ